MRWRTICLAVLPACTPQTELALPMLGDARTLIVSASSESLTSVFVAEAGGGAEVLEYRHRDGERLALELTPLPQTVDELDLTLGLQAADHPASQSYPLPFSPVRLQASFSDDESSPDWDAVMVTEAPDERFGLVPASLACLQAGGCLVPGGGGACDNPCPVAAPDPPAEPEPPEAPALVELRPCPRDWTEVATTEGEFRCQPWAAPTDLPCPPGQVHLPGSAVCTPLLHPCGPDRFHPDLPPGAPIYVDARAAAPGDGSLAAPYSSFSEAVAMAQDGAVVALARGDYEGGVEITRSIAVVGACAAEVRINAAPGGPALTLAGAVELQGVSLIGGALIAGPSARANLRGVELRDAPELGLSLEGGELSLQEVSITRSASVAVLVQGGRLTADRLVIHHVTRRALLARRASQLWLSRTVVQDVALTPTGARGDGIALAGATTATLTETVIERTHTVALSVGDPGTRLTASDAWIDSVQPESLRADYGDGIGVFRSASASVRRVQVGRASRHALAGFDDARATFEDVVVTDAVALSSGVAVFQNASVSLARSRLSGQGYGARVIDSGELRLIDFEIRGLVAGGIGLLVDENARLFLSRGAVHDFIGVGVLAASSGVLEAKDLEVFNVLRDTLNDDGTGLRAGVATRVRLERIRVREVGLVGFVLRSADAEAADLEVDSRLGTAMIVSGSTRLTRYRSRSSYGVVLDRSGELTAQDFSSRVQDRGSCTASALEVTATSTANLLRAQIEEAYGAGIRVNGTLRAEHLQVRNVQPYVDACVRDSLLAPGTYGAALEARGRALVQLTDFVLESSPIGASVDFEAGVSLERGVVRSSGVGLIAPSRLLPSVGSRFHFEQVPEIVRLRSVTP